MIEVFGYNAWKRGADVLWAALALAGLSPILAIVAMSVGLSSPGPILFRQRRTGRDRREFEMLKFRTMYVDAPSEVPTHLLTEQERHITPLGRILRRTSLDELPQLVNVLRGDMSIVGPRPALWNQTDLIEERDLYGVNGVRPGLTGWAQVKGRDELSIPQKAALDGYYVDHLGLRIDITCVLLTVGAVLKGSGVVDGPPLASIATDDSADSPAEEAD